MKQRMHERSRSLESTLIIAFILLSVTVLLISGCIELYFYYEAQRATIADKQHSIAKDAAKEVSNFIDEKISLMEAAVKLQDYVSLPLEQQKNKLGILLGIEPAYRYLLLLDENQNELAQVTRLSQYSSINYADRVKSSAISILRQGNKYIGSVYIDDTTSEPMIMLAVPVTNVLGDFTGALVAEVNLKFMWDLVDRIRVGKNGYAYVVDHKGQLIAFHNTSRVLRGENVRELEKVDESINPVEQFDENNSGFTTGINNSLVISTYIPLGLPNWAVVIEMPVWEAYSGVAINLIMLTGSIVIMALVAAYTGIRVGRRLSSPIILLSNTASRISRGETDLKANTEGPEEISVLATAFNNMTTKLITSLKKEEERTIALQSEVKHRKAVEHSLRESSSILNATLEATEDGVLVVGENDHISHYNSRFIEIWKIPDEVLNSGKDDKLIEFVQHQLEKPEQFISQIEALYGTTDISVDFLNFRDGRILERHSYPLDKNNYHSGRVWFFRDITEKKKVEKDLLITQFSVENAAVGIWLFDSDLKILNANKKVSEMLGYPKEELESMSLKDFVPEIDDEGWQRTWENILEVSQDTFISTHRRNDGTNIPVEVSSSLLEYEGEYYSIAFSTDITERKRAEDELNRLRNYLSNVVNSMPSVLVGVDSEGIVTQWNKTVEDKTGISMEKAQGKRLTDILPQMQSEMEKIKQSIKTRQIIQEQKITNTVEKDSEYEDVTIYPLITNGVEGAVIRIDDVTEKVRMEEMMIQSEKMLSVGGLAAGMAHEINNPLAGMLQTADVMANRLKDNPQIGANKRVAEEVGTSMEIIEAFMKSRGIPRMISTIMESGERVAGIVNNMLSFARKSDAIVSSGDLEELLNKTIELASTDYDMKKHYDFKTIKIEKEFAGDIPPVPCEGTKIQQVLLNILRNGAQAMQEVNTEKPHFIIRTKFDKKRKMAVMEIEDNGPGMTEETRKRVFEPFYTTKPVGDGTGLGLSVSYFIIVENHKGEMTVESQPGSGAKFTISLPVS